MADYDFSLNKAPQTFRIAYLGDSFVEGTCPAEDSVPALVQRNLKIPGKTVEVINTGTASYAPTIYYLLFTTKLAAYKPDVLVVNVDMTDVFDDSLYRMTLKYNAQGEPVACAPGHPAFRTHRRTERGLEELTPVQRAILAAAEYSSLVKVALDYVAEIARREPVDDGEVPPLFAWCAPTRSEKVKSDVAWSMSMLKRLIQEAKRGGVQVVVTGVPHRQQFEGLWSLQPFSDIESICVSEQVPFLNPIRGMHERLGDQAPSSIYIPGDMHFNPKGYRMWGDVQVEFLRRLVG
jgi:hypothetical protein